MSVPGALAVSANSSPQVKVDLLRIHRGFIVAAKNVSSERASKGNSNIVFSGGVEWEGQPLLVLPDERRWRL
jgi:hypothetical protein